MNTLKHCWDCKETKPTTCYSKQTRSKDGLQSRCKECDKKYREANKASKLHYNKKYYYANQEQILKQKKEYYSDNKEAILYKNANYYKQNYAKIYVVKKPYCRIKSAERRAIKLKATPKWLNKNQKEAIKLEYSLAEWCTKVLNEPYEVDHIVPLRGKDVCGLHVPWNLQVIAAKDNRIKNNRML